MHRAILTLLGTVFSPAIAPAHIHPVQQIGISRVVPQTLQQRIDFHVGKTVALSVGAI
jgi:hypothetical protein